jgi:hypothetical protein
MSVRMPTKDRFGISDHFMDMVRIPGYVELSDDTTATSGAAVAMVAADPGEHVDGHPLSPWVSDDDDPVEHQDEHDAGPEARTPSRHMTVQTSRCLWSLRLTTCQGSRGRQDPPEGGVQYTGRGRS